MKKYISFAMMALIMGFGFVSCDPETNEEAGGTAVEKMAGFWDVNIIALDDNTGAELDNVGTKHMMTYNTVENIATEMWLDDEKDFWGMKMKVDVNYDARTFASVAKPYAAGTQETATIIDGRVLEGAAKNVHGMPNDSIVFTVKFSDNKFAKYGFQHTYRIEGQRHTGFSPENE